MNKQELIDSITNATGESKKAVSEVLNSTIDTIKTQVSKGRGSAFPALERLSGATATHALPAIRRPVTLSTSRPRRFPRSRRAQEFKSSVAGKRKKK